MLPKKFGFFFFNPPKALSIALLFILGIVWKKLELSPFIPIPIFFALALVLKKRLINMQHLIFLCFIFAFYSGYTCLLVKEIKNKNAESALFNNEVDLILEINNKKNVAIKGYSNCITAKAIWSKNKKDYSWSKSNFYINIYTNNKKLNIGDYIQMFGLKFTKPNDSYKKYLEKEGIAASVFIPKLKYKLFYKTDFNFSNFIEKQKNKLLFKFKNKMPNETYSFFSSIFLGYKDKNIDSLNDMQDGFRFWGISHILARSGLHLVLIILIWQMLMSLLKINFKLRHITIIIIISIYSILTFRALPFNRALLTFLIYEICTLLELQSNMLHILSIACLVTLIINPTQLFALDFQLSYLITFSLIWLSHLNSKKRLNIENY